MANLVPRTYEVFKNVHKVMCERNGIIPVIEAHCVFVPLTNIYGTAILVGPHDVDSQPIKHSKKLKNVTLKNVQYYSKTGVASYLFMIPLSPKNLSLKFEKEHNYLYNNVGADKA